MRNYIVFILTALILSSCTSSPKQEGYTISGNAPGIYNGIRVYLNTINNGKQTPIDTAIVMSETFSFSGIAEKPGLHTLSVDNIRGSLQVIVNNDNFNVSVDKENIINSTVENSDDTDLYNHFNTTISNELKGLQSLMLKRRTASYQKDTTLVKSIEEDIKVEQARMQDLGFSLIKENPNSIVSLVFLEQQTRTQNLDLDKFNETFESLNSDLKASAKGKEIQAILSAIIEKKRKDEALQIGKIAPDFSAPGTDFKPIALNEVLGKYTIIDFWASWCGPCRRENPNVVKLYKQYHEKGLEIIGVSLDRQGGKQRWEKAIKDDNLTWQHVSNLDYFNCPVAKLYNVSSIPSTYLLDEKGTIVGKNLRGVALELKLKELFGE